MNESLTSHSFSGTERLENFEAFKTTNRKLIELERQHHKTGTVYQEGMLGLLRHP